METTPGGASHTTGIAFTTRIAVPVMPAVLWSPSSPRGSIEVPARLRDLREGVVFVPFHYGYWDLGEEAGPDGQPRAANELTMTIWDPVSKQPQLKTAAVKLERAR